MIAHLYKITNNLTNQYYIGKRRGSEQGRYWGSGLRIKRHIKKYGKEFLEMVKRYNEKFPLAS